MDPRKALVYARISQDRTGAGLGVTRQRRDCEKLAESLGWTVVGTHSDNDISAYSGKTRPGYRALLADLEAGRADAVLAWHTDRLHRSPRELEEYVDVCERHHVITQTVQAGELDLATPSGRAVARTLGAWARFESEHKSERVKRAQEQAAKSGRWLGGARPLGWNLRDDGSATLDAPAARRIRQATEDVLTGVSLGTIVRRWNDEGFSTGTYGHGCTDKSTCKTEEKPNKGAECPARVARQWNYSTLRQVLTRARNAGLAEFRGEIVGTTTWPAIVTEEQWRALCAMLTNPTRRRSQSNRVKHLMAGIAVCGAEGCGTPLKSGAAGGKNNRVPRTIYRCPVRGSGHVGRAADEIDALVSSVIVGYLRRESVAVTSSVPGVDSAELRGRVETLRQRLDAFHEHAAEMDPADYAAAVRTVRDKLRDAEVALAESAQPSALSGIADAVDPGAAWEDAPIDKKRAVIRELIDVTVLPLPPGKWARVFHPELIHIEWRH